MRLILTALYSVVLKAGLLRPARHSHPVNLHDETSYFALMDDADTWVELSLVPDGNGGVQADITVHCGDQSEIVVETPAICTSESELQCDEAIIRGFVGELSRRCPELGATECDFLTISFPPPTGDRDPLSSPEIGILVGRLPLTLARGGSD
ncbi:hypothetical protein FOL47_000100 [Perkinsus chesapeaki]|uniref:Uncharacterized protein n=1 Tax=Perkinsus chesapeaki TaxID=330153 RepID=A0A7J6N2H1_PERCH|nr:hypothetical protein FOL47_000100 [Perkinsus chesapeaki]